MYKIDLQLKHKNKKLKHFRFDCGLSLKESDKIFQLHIWIVNVLKKLISSINRIVIRREKNGYHPYEKHTSFNILCLASQLYRLKSIHLESLEQKKIYFLENQVQDFIKLGIEYLPKVVKAYKKVIRKYLVNIGEKTLLNDKARNKNIKLFFK